MGCRILDGGEDGAVFYCSTSDWAFGPVFASAEDAEKFQEWLTCDPRALSEQDLQARYSDWLKERNP